MAATLRVLVGAPGSGKSTWCAQHAGLGVVLSLDAARAELGSGEDDQSVTPDAVELVESRAAAWLRGGRSVVIDATGATPYDRERWLRLARETGAVPVATKFRVPLRVCRARNRSRRRRVPEHIVRRIWRAVDATSTRCLRREGFVRVEAPRRFGRAAPG